MGFNSDGVLYSGGKIFVGSGKFVFLRLGGVWDLGSFRVAGRGVYWL